ncbi:unnamed protein product [Ostreobium quekettii]|uniref:malate dehydrogenase (NADP(+)) n=1 Tax=Ostreobium quekettii TaxID=121088 RepID=A0A8S1JIR3_9CHLO|nr:unnamed protein product [Ostreobium quekettii]|eukprot:evm.model.scf_2327.1 EVM.evm.TU.scf_2327.1   scf_2327:9073-14052(-)
MAPATPFSCSKQIAVAGGHARLVRPPACVLPRLRQRRPTRIFAASGNTATADSKANLRNLTYDLSEASASNGESQTKPIKVAVSGAAGQISNHLLFMLASGQVFGPNAPIILQLLGSERSINAIEGVSMELEDSLYPLLREIKMGIDPIEVFEDADWALLIGAKPRSKGMERADLLDVNGRVFAEQGRALNEVASRDVKVVVVGNPCNTNALIAMENAPDLPPKNFSALTRLDQNRARFQLAVKAGVPFDKVSRVAVWGNHSTTQVPDWVNARIGDTPASKVIDDEAWFKEDFTPKVATRGASVIQKWGRSSGASTAGSIADHVRSLIQPTPEGDCFSMAISTDGNPYGIADGLFYSMPCTSTGNGDYDIVPGFEVDEWLSSKMKASEEELIREKECVAHLIGLEGAACAITEDTMLPGEN